MQSDGNFVVRRNSDNKALWHAGTHGNSGARAVMQSDGNFVVYAANNAVLWASNTVNGRSRLVMQNDGNLVIYSSASRALWASNTVQSPTANVTISYTENPFVCDGSSRNFGTLRGFASGERVTFSSPQESGLLPGTATSGGSIAVRWQCFSGDVGTTWQITARGQSSGRSLTFNLGSRGAIARHPGQPTICPGQSTNLRPTANVSFPTDYKNVLRHSRAPSLGEWLSYAGSGQFRADQLLAEGSADVLAANLSYVSLGLQRHFQAGTGQTYTISMADLIWEERPLWASLEWHLRNEATDALNTARSVSGPGGCVIPFDSGWFDYTATGDGGPLSRSLDWHFALRKFNARVLGDIWVGPLNANGDRSVSLRYRVVMEDVYDFALGDIRTDHLARLEQYASARNFRVIGHGRTRFETGYLSTANFERVGLNW